MHRRLKAACEALPFVHPKLAVSAQVNGDDFARTLELAMRRSAKVISQPKAIEHQCLTEDIDGGDATNSHQLAQ
jgi:hypothetical protein